MNYVISIAVGASGAISRVYQRGFERPCRSSTAEVVRCHWGAMATQAEENGFD
jgi:hypothetical protein